LLARFIICCCWSRCDLGSNNFKTILSYGCPNNVAAPEVGMFSTPDRRTRNGIAIGDANRGHCARCV
jgi:hypothetical protein